jgi:hypothetical protein
MSEEMEKGMHTNNRKLEALEKFTQKLAYGFAAGILLLLLGLMLTAGFAGSSLAQDAQPRKFASPEEASSALFQAAQKEDEPALEAVLGAGREVTSSSDEVEDKLEREQFCRKYQEMHRLVREEDGNTVLYIGAENWPFPIPLVSKDGAWYFDSQAGMEEIKFRRIGENEATAIEVCEEFAIAKREGIARNVDDAKASSEDPITRFAQSLIATGGATSDTSASAPFHGYYFQVVEGNSAAGKVGDGSGDKKRGVAVLIAYPADYRSSGVKTFAVSRKGVVFEKDLGPDTTKVAPGVRVHTSEWRPAE